MRTPSVLLLALLLAALVGPSAAAQEWESVSPLRTPRAGAAGAVLDGQLFVIGGRDAEGKPLASVEVFQPGVGWTVLASLQQARVNAAAAVLGGRVVVLGGADADGEPMAGAEVYDPVQSLWLPFDSLGIPREGPGAASLDSLLYVVGGAATDTTVLGSVEVYGGIWAPLTTWKLTPPRAQFGTVVLDGGIVVIGGFSDVGPVRDVERFDPATGMVTALEPLPTASGSVAAVVHDGRIFVVGGRNADDEVSRQVLALTPGAVWEPQTPLPEPIEGAVAGVLGTHLYVVGGGDEFGGVLSRVDRLPLRAVDVAADAVPRGGPQLRVVGPNPARSGTAVEVRGDASIRVSVADLLGREVAVLHEGPVRGTLRVRWDGRVPAGVYVVRAVGPGGMASAALTVVR